LEFQQTMFYTSYLYAGAYNAPYLRISNILAIGSQEIEGNNGPLFGHILKHAITVHLC